MIKINKISYHDRKGEKLWFNVLGEKDGIRFFGITLTRHGETSIKFMRYQSYTPEEGKEMDKRGIREGEEVFFTKEEKNDLIHTVNDFSIVYNKNKYKKVC